MTLRALATIPALCLAAAGALAGTAAMLYATDCGIE